METNIHTAIITLPYNQAKTYQLSGLFILGNILFPQLCHLIPNGGLTWLPIYFFTLIASYKYGIFTGMATAILSPIVNHILFDMPPAGMLPIILIKSSLLAIAAASFAHAMGKVCFTAILLTILTYQGLGTIIEWLLSSSLAVALQDIQIGWPGILLQLFAGWIILHHPLKK